MLRPDYHHEASGGLYQNIMMKQAFQKNVPSLSRVFDESISYAFMDNTFIHGYDYYRSLQEEENILTEDAYNQSEYKRQNINWHEGMTEMQAQVLSERYDRDAFYAQYTQNISAFNPARIGGLLVGGIPDPINYIPFLGWAARISKVANTVNKMPILGMAANAMIGQSAFETVKWSTIHDMGGDVNFEAALIDVAIAGMIGSGAGLLFGGIGKNSGLQEKLGQIEYQKKLPWTEHSDDLVVSGVHIVDGVPINSRGKRLIGDPDSPPQSGHPPTKEVDPDQLWTQEEWRQEQIKNQEKTIDDNINQTKQEQPELTKLFDQTVESLSNVLRKAKSCTLGFFS